MEKGISEMNDLPLIKCPDDVAVIWRKGISEMTCRKNTISQKISICARNEQHIRNQRKKIHKIHH